MTTITPPRFGLTHSTIRRISEQYDVLPVTVWDLNHADKKLKIHKKTIGDDGDTRADSPVTNTYKTNVGSSKNNASIFNPNIIGSIFNLYKPPLEANIYDPFGGGGTRAIITAGQEDKYNYIGVEIREEEVARINAKIARMEKDDKGINRLFGKIKMIHGSSEHVPDIPDQWADMIITCPPYYNRERYNGGDDDISMALTYDEFLSKLNSVIDECYRILKPGCLAFWIVGLHRDKHGLIPIHHDLAILHREGFIFQEEIILHMKNTGSVQRIGNYLKGNHLLIRNHEYCLVFKKE